MGARVEPGALATQGVVDDQLEERSTKGASSPKRFTDLHAARDHIGFALHIAHRGLLAGLQRAERFAQAPPVRQKRRISRSAASIAWRSCRAVAV
jgi:hypothetical protein